MEYLVDLLLLGAVFLVYRSGRKDLAKTSEEMEARVGAVREKSERLYEKSNKRFTEHIQNRMHGR